MPTCSRSRQKSKARQKSRSRMPSTRDLWIQKRQSRGIKVPSVSQRARNLDGKRHAAGKNHALYGKRPAGDKPKEMNDKLLAVVGGSKKSLHRSEITQKVWNYIKRNDLNNGRLIDVDKKLGALNGVGGKTKIHMINDLQGIISKNIS